MGRDLSRVAEPDARGRAFHQRKGVLGGEAGQVDVESGRAGIDGDRLGPIRDLDEMLREAREGAAVALEIEAAQRSEEHTSELQSLMRISYAVFCLKKKKQTTRDTTKITNEIQKQ